MSFLRWPSIESLAHVKKNLEHDSSLMEKAKNGITYQGKVKLHGVNSAVNIYSKDGEVIVQSQSRNGLLDKGGFGFYPWVKTNETYFQNVYQNRPDQSKQHYLIFGEWCGQGVQKGVAISKVQKKFFAVFAIVQDLELIVDPDEIGRHFPKEFPGSSTIPEEFHILPWFKHSALPDGTLTVTFGNNEKEKETLTALQTLISDIDQQDPWAAEVLGVSGPGEGVVWYPNPQSPEFSLEFFTTFAFKAKGEAHLTQKEPKKGKTESLEISKISNPKKFVDVFVTEARLQQGLTEVFQENPPILTEEEKFVEWVVKDVKKESKHELEENKLSWEKIEPIIKNMSAKWFKNHLATAGLEDTMSGLFV